MLLSKNFLSILIPLFYFSACLAQSPKTIEISPAEFEKGINQPNVQVLDVRTMGEFKSGYLNKALLADWNNQDEFAYRIKGLDKSKPVYTYCLSGGRSGAAAKYLADKGFTVYHLKGGISAWKKADMPVVAPVVVKQLTTSEFTALIPANRTVLVDVGAEWCPPCKVMNPVIDSLSKVGGVSFALVKIDGGEQVALTKTLLIDAFPTFIVYKNGKETWRATGIMSATEIIKHL